jgi:hypothetical protein
MPVGALTIGQDAAMGVLMMLLLVAVVAALVAGSAGYVLGRSAAAVAPAPVADPGALAERDAFIEQLRELAWQHRDVSPELSTIVIDEIATHHRRLSGPHD